MMKLTLAEVSRRMAGNSDDAGLFGEQPMVPISWLHALQRRLQEFADVAELRTVSILIPVRSRAAMWGDAQRVTFDGLRSRRVSRMWQRHRRPR